MRLSLTSHYFQTDGGERCGGLGTRSGGWNGSLSESKEVKLSELVSKHNDEGESREMDEGRGKDNVEGEKKKEQRL